MVKEIIATSDGQVQQTRTGKTTTTFYAEVDGERARITIWESAQVQSGARLSGEMTFKEVYNGTPQY